MPTIKQLREKIEKTDAAILKKLALRQKLSLQIGKLKAKNGKTIKDDQREKQLMRFYKKLSKQYQLPYLMVKRIFSIIIHHCRTVQK